MGSIRKVWGEAINPKRKWSFHPEGPTERNLEACFPRRCEGRDPPDESPCCLLLQSRLGPLNQSPLVPNSNCFNTVQKISHIFKAIWSLPTLHIPQNFSQHLLTTDKSNSIATKHPNPLLPFGAIWHRDSPLRCWRTLPRQSSSLSDFPVCPGNSLALSCIRVVALCLCLSKISCWEGLPFSYTPVQALSK